METTLLPEPTIADARRLLSEGRFEEGLSAIEVLRRSQSDDAAIEQVYATALYLLKRPAEAVAAFRATLALDPASTAARQNMIMALLDLDQVAEAVKVGREAVALAPTSVGARRNLNIALSRAESWGEAEEAARSALAMAERDAVLWAQYGHVLSRLGQFDKAEQCLRRALELEPNNHEALFNLGVVMQDAGRDSEAIEAYRRALERDPGHKGARLNLGVMYRNSNRLAEAREVWRRSLDPPEQWPELAYNLACTELLAGNWAGAWAGYELRLKTLPKATVTTRSDTPVWDGAPAPGKTLLVVHEQGLGDTIQFVRLLADVVPRVRRIVMVAQAPLHGLLSTMALFRSGDGRALLIRQGETPPAHDLHVSLMSLPHLLDLDPRSLKAVVPYIAPEAARIRKWADRLQRHDTAPRRAFRIGLVWQGNPNAAVERGRSIPLSAFAPLARFGDEVRFFALQKGHGAEQWPPPGMNLIRLGEDFDAGPDAFLDTAAVIAGLDLVITSDTSVAHVAGALGRPVWLLLRYVPDWRWGLEGVLTPWYPTMRLFRQKVARDWGGVFAEVERELDALLALRRGPALSPGEDGERLFRAAIDAHQARRHDEALSIYRRLAAAFPNNHRILNLLGMCLFEAAGRSRAVATAEALPIVLRSVAVTTNEPDDFSNLAVVLDRSGLREDGTRALRHALAIRPKHQPSQLAMANRDIASGDVTSALARVDAVLVEEPGLAAALSIKGAALLAQGDVDKAELALRLAVQRDTHNPRLLVQWGAILAQKEDHKGAARAWDRALVIDPRNADALSNLGVEERNRGEVGIAFHFLRRSVQVDPSHAEAFSNLGITALEAGAEDEAIAAFREAIRLRPDYADARMALGMALMNRGLYEEGLPQYEWRLGSEKLGLAKSRPKLPLWQGEDPRGKSFLVVAEQGFGDAFQFVRYVRVLKERGAAKVIVGCRARIAALMARVSGVDGVVAEGSQIPPLDYCVFMMSLPLRTGTRVETIPAFANYLSADPARVTAWASRLAARPGFRVGIVWQGNPDPQVDRGRSFPLKVMEPLARVPGVRLIALQKGTGEEQIEALKGRFPVETLGADFDSGPDAFADTAAVIMNLDLVITSDTAVAHVAGALGRPTWVVLRHNPEWRWLRNRSDSPWYPSARLFRRVEGEVESAPFAGVMGRVASALTRLVAGDRSQLYVTEPPVVPVPEKPPATERFRIALAAHIKGDVATARAGYAALLVTHPRAADALHMLGAVALAEFNYNRALILFRDAEALGLSTPEFKTNYAIALRHTDGEAKAEALLRSLIAEKPTAEAEMTLGNLLRDDGRFEEAVALYESAVARRPDLAKAHRGLGNALKDLNRCDESLAAFARAIELTPTDPELLLDHAHALLLAGDYRQGFARYEIRWQAMEMLPRHFDVLRWRGETYPGRTLLVHGEQGIGDQIQFARFLPLAAARGGRLVVEVRPALCDLIRRMDFGGVEVDVVEQGRRLPRHDLEVPMMSLPDVFGVDIDRLPPPPDFRIDPVRVASWRQSLGGAGKLRVGLVWQGNPKARADAGRSPPLRALEPLFAVPGIHFVSLQHRDGLDQLQGFPHADRIEVVAERLAGFSETAAAMMAMDLIISSCTSSVHLAGSLGLPTFVMLRANADWRWLTDRDDSPWYPTARLFRQPRWGDWGSVAADVAAALAEWAGRS